MTTEAGTWVAQIYFTMKEVSEAFLNIVRDCIMHMSSNESDCGVSLLCTGASFIMSGTEI
jgi:hypothetical protein